jgi:stage II sporulation protein D
LTARAAAGRFSLEVPGKLRREYDGSLAISLRGDVLEAVVTMPLETAVASVVQAESPPGAGLEALKAQAVAARSFLVARQTSHLDFDFCDTTHCQFLRSPPAAGSAAAQATRATAGLVLGWFEEGSATVQTLAAMYARSCGGRTRTLEEIGVKAKGYPYYVVLCTYCSHHPELWRRAPGASAQAGIGSGAAPQTERERLAFNHIHGWGAMPSLLVNGAIDSKNGVGRAGALEGKGVGHGIGMCQLGAADMARRGAGFADILTHYYPNTTLTTISPR